MRQNSFTFSSRNKRLIAFILLLALFLAAVNKLFMYNYYQDDEWNRILLHNFYNSEDIDNLYLGSSHIYYDINPNIMDYLTGENNFNLASPSQELITSYYLLKEALRKNNPKHVFLELYYVPSTGQSGDYSSDEAIKNMWKITDVMKLSMNKLQAIWNENGTEHLIEAALPFTRFRKYIFNQNYIIDRHIKKRDADFLAYEYKSETERGIIIYQDKGYYYSDYEISNLNYGSQRNSDDIFLTHDAEEYLKKIIELCEKNEIEITLIISPIYELQMLSINTYDIYRNKIADIANEYEVEFYDFNLIKEEYLSIQKPELFYDIGHLNYKGAELYTKFLYELVYENKYEKEDIFYKTYEEKINTIPEKTWGIYYEAYTGALLFHIASSPRDGLKYRIIVTPDNGEQYMVQDFSENDTFSLRDKGSGIITVVTKFSDESVSTIEVRYSN